VLALALAIVALAVAVYVTVPASHPLRVVQMNEDGAIPVPTCIVVQGEPAPLCNFR
jgi:hypothetical protein